MPNPYRFTRTESGIELHRHDGGIVLVHLLGDDEEAIKAAMRAFLESEDGE